MKISCFIFLGIKCNMLKLSEMNFGPEVCDILFWLTVVYFYYIKFPHWRLRIWPKPGSKNTNLTLCTSKQQNVRLFIYKEYLWICFVNSLSFWIRKYIKYTNVVQTNVSVSHWLFVYLHLTLFEDFGSISLIRMENIKTQPKYFCIFTKF